MIVARAPAAGAALRAKCMMFGQALPRSLAHFELGIFRKTPPAGGGPAIPVRAGMGSQFGTGTLDQSNNVGTTDFVAAHECGHGFSLNDEYIEQVFEPGTPPRPASIRNRGCSASTATSPAGRTRWTRTTAPFQATRA